MSMKKILRNVLSVVVIVFIFNLVGCDKGGALNELGSLLLNSNKNSIVFDENEISKDEVMAYESPYKDASTTYFKDKLSEEEQELYKIFVYAYEHENEKIKYYSSNSNLGDSYKKIVQSICAENPFIDWNQTYTYTYSSGCYEFTSSQLDKKDVNLKIQAYNKAKELVQAIPQNYSTYEKVSWIYSYIVNNINYVDDINAYLNGSPSFIYDGLIGGKTQCSGFADTMTMMCNLAGIQTISVCGENEEGHAWNLVNLDGEFYYCDPTSDSNIKTGLPESAKNLYLSFLKSYDVFSANGYVLNDDIVIDFPKALNTKYDSNNVDFNLSDFSNENDLIKISKKLIENKNYVVVHLQNVSAKDTKEVDDAVNYILKYISNNINSNIYSYVTIQDLINEGSNDVVFFVSLEK